MNKIEFDEAEFSAFFARTFEEESCSPHEMRLSREEAGYLKRRYTELVLRPLSEKDGAGKVWFEVRPEGAAVL